MIEIMTAVDLAPLFTSCGTYYHLFTIVAFTSTSLAWKDGDGYLA